jgi:hypothetical protein
MTAVLTRYFSKKGLERLLPYLNEGYQNLTRLLISNLAEDGRAVVADLLTHLFPASTTASANSSLNRLLTTLNKTAREHGVPLFLLCHKFLTGDRGDARLKCCC